MTTLDLSRLDSALQARATELMRSLTERNLIAIERSADAFDEALQASDRESSAHNLAHEFSLLRQVQAARDRIRSGTFGARLRCEEEIAPKRLYAIPWAAYCLSCQTAREAEGHREVGSARAA